MYIRNKDGSTLQAIPDEWKQQINVEVVIAEPKNSEQVDNIEDIIKGDNIEPKNSLEKNTEQEKIAKYNTENETNVIISNIPMLDDIFTEISNIQMTNSSVPRRHLDLDNFKKGTQDSPIKRNRENVHTKIDKEISTNNIFDTNIRNRDFNSVNHKQSQTSVGENIKNISQNASEDLIEEFYNTLEYEAYTALNISYILDVLYGVNETADGSNALKKVEENMESNKNDKITDNMHKTEMTHAKKNLKETDNNATPRGAATSNGNFKKDSEDQEKEFKSIRMEKEDRKKFLDEMDNFVRFETKISNDKNAEDINCGNLDILVGLL